MDMPKNYFKAALQIKQLQKGLWCTIDEPLAVEMMANCGFDWILFDTEHSAMDPITVAPLLQAVAPYEISAIVRPGSLNPAEIKKLLDLGAQTILVPLVQNAEEAALAVASVTYPPQGIRGVSGITRATRFGTVQGYHKAAHEEICVLVQVETTEAVDQIEEIAAVPGIDGIFVGPADLAASLGHAGETSHPEVVRASIDAIKRITATGKPAGFLSADQAFAKKAIDAGALFVGIDVDMAALRRALNERLVSFDQS